jgi:hypothetical protein
MPGRARHDKPKKEKAAMQTMAAFFQLAGLLASYLMPAAAFSICALSVRSQVNSGSSRPKWP